MSRVCQITGKKRMSGNNVSHANNKTRRVFNVNLQAARVFSESLKRFVSIRVTPAGLRTIEHNGGIDGFLMSRTPSELDPKLRKLRKEVEAAKTAA